MSEDEDPYWSGVELGMRASIAIIKRIIPVSHASVAINEITNEITNIGNHRNLIKGGAPAIDGELEWQSWMVQMELHSWQNGCPGGDATPVAVGARKEK